eukprot:CAMPEP_0181097032 /NCGR_PEP_ID=MMETSP1071-20121207/11349_1 /TAXON_ID=35127 /ORGANISM="Thalassiosira sp., Strain NH16" /LENGTH=354 /DNA_ID=CAMNT_0023179479 /DNA_START=810 /DNA_END=1874 /DNA_ORIENTATION=-
MGYDANVKSLKSEQRQRIIIVISLVALSAAFFLVVSLLKPPSTNNGIGGASRVSHPTPKAASAGGGRLRGEKLEVLEEASQAEAAIREDKTEESNAMPQPVTRNSEKEAAAIRADLEARVRDVKKTGVIMETDKQSLELTGQLQDATRELIKLRYGDYGDGTKKFRVKLDLEFQSTIPDFEEKGSEGSLLLELAPISLLPCSVYNFLEIARTWRKGAFHRNANHVLQAISRSDITERMPFQEYSKEYPHKRGTMGYAGRPSGPEFYISIQDNSEAHGPGSQQQHNPYEADCIIGTVIEGMEDGTVDRIHTMPGKEFMGDKKKWVLIRRMHVLVPGDGSDGYVEFSKSPLEIPKD